MKKTIFFLNFILLLSCSTESAKEALDNEVNIEYDFKIDPPDWILGTWENEDLNTSYTLTKDNLISRYEVRGNMIEENFKDLYKNKTWGVASKAYEDLDEDTGETKIWFRVRVKAYSNDGNNGSFTEDFTKVSDTEIIAYRNWRPKANNKREVTLTKK